jgi:hypothetical protein
MPNWTVAQIEMMILEAANFEKRMSSVRAPGYSKYWPTIFYEPIDFGFHAAQLAMHGATGVGMDAEKLVEERSVAPRKDVYDLVMLEWFGPTCPLSIRGRQIVWGRLGRGYKLSWQKLASELNSTIFLTQKNYVNCLELLRMRINMA